MSEQVVFLLGFGMLFWVILSSFGATWQLWYFWLIHQSHRRVRIRNRNMIDASATNYESQLALAFCHTALWVLGCWLLAEVLPALRKPQPASAFEPLFIVEVIATLMVCLLIGVLVRNWLRMQRMQVRLETPETHETV
jgi:hypothetical protein